MQAQHPAILAAALESLWRPLRRVARDLDQLCRVGPHFDRVPAFTVGHYLPFGRVDRLRSAARAPCWIHTQAKRGLSGVVLRSAEEIGRVGPCGADERESRDER